MVVTVLAVFILGSVKNNNIITVEFVMFERGTVFVRQGYPDALYLLVRVSAGVHGTTANGTPTSSKYLWNLVNLTNDGKARVSDHQRLLETTNNYVTLQELTNHFDMHLASVGRIEEFDQLKRTANYWQGIKFPRVNYAEENFKAAIHDLLNSLTAFVY